MERKVEKRNYRNGNDEGKKMWIFQNDDKEKEKRRKKEKVKRTKRWEKENKFERK